ncbi:MAG: hypothetical protein JSC085_000668 [Candidatus Tokpelaia sp. JSC085]|nr:MAG: hypothetical protein JSC085_000668 [Candidatus Tokpelaia sp. JSC085]
MGKNQGSNVDFLGCSFFYWQRYNRFFSVPQLIKTKPVLQALLLLCFMIVCGGTTRFHIAWPPERGLDFLLYDLMDMVILAFDNWY